MEARPTLTHDEALAVLDAVREELDRRGVGAAVAVCDDHGELMAFLRTDGCRLPSITIAMNKAYTAAREQVPSKEVGTASRVQGFPMTNFGELRYVSWGGGLPLTAAGKVVGGVGVSGLPEDEDLEIANLGRAAFESLARPPFVADGAGALPHAADGGEGVT
ncbi:MAG TPA: heme-binding protein [Acidimicrobiia bacterium]|nr:heme-binding protein [Acidimicrobiia bacterium]